MDVPYHTTHSDDVYSVLRRLKTSLPAHKQRAFAASDANARKCDWQVTRIRRGLSQIYRDASSGYRSARAAGSGGGCSSCRPQRSEHCLKEPAP